MKHTWKNERETANTYERIIQRELETPKMWED